MTAPSHPHATAVILAAGLGTRMKSSLPKAAHPIAGRPMLRHLIAACEAVFGRIAVVVGPDMKALEDLARHHAIDQCSGAARGEIYDLLFRQRL